MTQARSPSTASCAPFPTGRRSATTRSIRSRTAARTNITPAGSSVSTFQWEGTALTPFVCYDLRFADLFWALAPSTDCYLVVANWPSPRQSHFRALAVARAIENQAYVLATNRVGTGGGLHYTGGTIAVGPLGEVLAEAGDGEETLHVEVSAARVREVREAYPFLRDRRPFSVTSMGEAKTPGATMAEGAVRG